MSSDSFGLPFSTGRSRPESHFAATHVLGMIEQSAKAPQFAKWNHRPAKSRSPVGRSCWPFQEKARGRGFHGRMELLLGFECFLDSLTNKLGRYPILEFEGTMECHIKG